VQIGPAIACEANSTVNGLFKDIVRRTVTKSPGLLKNTKITVRLGALGIDLESQAEGFRRDVSVESVNQGSDILATLFPADHETGRKHVVIIDEFDQLENRTTIHFLTNLAKQMSVEAVNVKIAFCGVASDLRLLIGAHKSVGRYISAIKLEPLSDDSIWEVVNRILLQFDTQLNRGQTIRIGQIACGYPTFAHLIVDEVLNVSYERKLTSSLVTQDVFNEAMRRSASGAATHLQNAYEAATMKGTDRYVEVLWAVANAEHIQARQFKHVKADYERIMRQRRDRDALTSEQRFEIT
jgi:hypothetical protein